MVMDKMVAHLVVDTLAFSLLATYLPPWGLTILCFTHGLLALSQRYEGLTSWRIEMERNGSRYQLIF